MKFPIIKDINKMEHIEQLLLFSNASVFERIDGLECKLIKDNHQVINSARHNIKCSGFRDWVWENYFSFLKLSTGIYFGRFVLASNDDYKEEFKNQFFLTDIYSNGVLLPYKQNLAMVERTPQIITLEPLYEGELCKDRLIGLLKTRSKYYKNGAMPGLEVRNYKEKMFGMLEQASLNR